MASEFDQKGFSAVAAFFGKEGQSPKDAGGPSPEGKTSSKKLSQQNKRGANRLGLGASSKDKSTGAPIAGGAADAKKQILGVGRKNRGRGRQHEDDDEASAGDDSDSDDNEEGRTVAVKQAKPKEDAEDAALRKAPRKKRKKKKKGGQEHQMQEVATSDRASGKEEGESRPSKADEETKAKIEDGPIKRNEMETANDVAPQETARKRRKVRSRQKNIRKDHRSDAEKPAHLLLGGEAYAGRSMTRETRQRLNLPESKARSRHSRMVKRSIDGEGVVAPAAPGGQSGGGGYDLGLAIDDYLDVGGEAAVAEKSQEPVVEKSQKRYTKSKEKKKRTRKMKYKNA